MPDEHPPSYSAVGTRSSRRMPSRIMEPARLLPRHPQQRRFNRRLLAVLVCLGLIAVVVRSTSRLGDATQVPAELIGKWETDNSRYAGRALIFRSDAMTFQAGPRDAGSSNRIRGVKKRQRAGVTDYVIVGYSDAEGETTVTLRYLVAEQIIELLNLDGVLWRRVR